MFTMIKSEFLCLWVVEMFDYLCKNTSLLQNVIFQSFDSRCTCVSIFFWHQWRSSSSLGLRLVMELTNRLPPATKQQRARWEPKLVIRLTKSSIVRLLVVHLLDEAFPCPLQVSSLKKLPPMSLARIGGGIIHLGMPFDLPFQIC